MKVFWIILGCVIGLPITLFLVFITYIGVVGPDTKIVTGQRIKHAHKRTIQDLQLLEKDEKIEYFYSDALTDVKDGMYMITNKHLILYSDFLEPPKNIIPFVAIKEVDLERHLGFFEDSEITVSLYNGLEFYFPLSTELSGDKRFTQRLKEKANLLPLPEPRKEPFLKKDSSNFDHLLKED